MSKCISGFLYFFEKREIMTYVGYAEPLGIDHHAVFYTKSSDNDKAEHFIVSETPGKIYGNTVWFQELNMLAAIELFKMDAKKKSEHFLKQVEIYRKQWDMLDEFWIRMKDLDYNKYNLGGFLL